MTVIPFPTVRFAPEDVALFDRIAAPMVRRGLWDRVQRDAPAGADRLVVWIPGVERPLFAFERVRGGRYRLTLHEKEGATYEIGRGWTARECLRIWLRHAEPADGGARPAV